MNLEKWCYLSLFFQALMLLWSVLCVSVIVAKVFKMLVSQFFLAFVGWLILVYFGFGRFRCFCGSCVWVFFCSGFVFVSVLLLVLFLFCFYCFCFFCFFWRVEGSGEVAQRATSLGHKPSLFSFSLFFFAFLFCFLIEKACFPPKRAFLCTFLCFPLFLFSLFGPPPFSLSLSLSLSCSFLSSFLSVFHVCIWFLIFLFVLFAFLFQDFTLF